MLAWQPQPAEVRGLLGLAVDRAKFRCAKLPASPALPEYSLNNQATSRSSSPSHSRGLPWLGLLIPGNLRQAAEHEQVCLGICMLVDAAFSHHHFISRPISSTDGQGNLMLWPQLGQGSSQMCPVSSACLQASSSVRKGQGTERLLHIRMLTDQA